MHSCGSAAIKGWCWPNFWANYLGGFRTRGGVGVISHGRGRGLAVGRVPSRGR
jgi:hypothetical protein